MDEIAHMNSLRRRLERLEKHYLSEPILLQMPDRSTKTLDGHPNYLLDLMMRSLEGEQVPEMDLIAQSISAEEPGGAHMVDMARLVHAVTRKQVQPEHDPA